MEYIFVLANQQFKATDEAGNEKLHQNRCLIIFLKAMIMLSLFLLKTVGYAFVISFEDS